MTPKMITSLEKDDSDIVKTINLLFDMMKDTQEKAFGGIINNNF